jgi:hypothetical protein
VLLPAQRGNNTHNKDKEHAQNIGFEQGLDYIMPVIAHAQKIRFFPVLCL